MRQLCGVKHIHCRVDKHLGLCQRFMLRAFRPAGNLSMLSELIVPLRNVVRWLMARHSPPELAAGFTIGMIVGLVPKGNLIALSLCVLLFSMRVNKGLGVVAALFISCLATNADSFAHRLGSIVLGFEPMQAVYAQLYSLPLGPWLGFNNTVNTGMLLLGLYIAYPAFFLTRVLATWLETRLAFWSGDTRCAIAAAVEQEAIPPRAAA